MRGAVVVGLAVLALAAGCGGDGDGGTDATATTAPAADESTTTTEATLETVPEGPDNSVAVLEAFIAGLGWDDAEIAGTGVRDEFTVSSATYGDATAALENGPDGYVVVDFDSFGDVTLPASVSFGNGRDMVSFGYQDPALTPVLSVTYGADLSTGIAREGELGGPAAWDDLQLDPAEDTGERLVVITWRDDASVAHEAWVRMIPAGPFAAG